MSDRLGASFAALREEAQGSSPSAGATRARVLLEVTARRRRRASALRWVIPIAAVLGATSAWAALSGTLARFVATTDTSAEHPEQASMPPPPRVAPAAPSSIAPRPSPPKEETTEVVSPVPAAPPAAEPSATVARANGGSEAITPPVARPGRRAAQDDPDEALFRRAHQAHFANADATRALAAWDAYLAAFPAGHFAPEAQYNRGLVLVRLGRRAEARAALRPFAEGAFGGYRQDEARKLRDALE